jgi:hypothetical protein
VAVGAGAGVSNQGSSSIAIGTEAGKTDQKENSIVINATGVALSSTTTGLFVKPVRQNILSPSNHVATYNPTSGEISYDDTFSSIPFGSIPFYQVETRNVVFHTEANNGTRQTVSVRYERNGNVVTMIIPEVTVNIGNPTYQFITAVGEGGTNFYPDFAVPTPATGITHSVIAKTAQNTGVNGMIRFVNTDIQLYRITSLSGTQWNGSDNGTFGSTILTYICSN